MIKKIEHWDFTRVRSLCIQQNWYTCGDCDDYDNMLNYVIEHKNGPSIDDLKHVAADILAHSDDDNTITNIMCYLANDTITMTFLDTND